MNTFLLILGSSAIKASVLLLLAGAVTRLLRAHSAALRHAVWATAMVATLLIPLADASLPVLHVIHLSDALWTFGTSAPAASGAVPGFQPLPAESLPSGTPSLGGASTARRFDWLWTLVVLIWAGGAACVGARTLAAHRRVRGFLRRATLLREGPLPRMARELSQSSQNRPIAILESAELEVPATMGIWQPAIAVPSGAESWHPAEVRAVLAHELAHIRRRDCLIQAISRVACTMYWFNPLVWIADRHLAVERERACDDEVLGAGASPTEYAGLLLQLVRSESTRTVAALSFVRTGELETRLRAILQTDLRRGSLRHSVRSVVVASLSGMVLLSGSTGVELVPGAGLAALARVEPDTRRDSLFSGLSERLPPVELGYAVRRARSAESGPDSGLVRILLEALDRTPQGPGDLVRERAIWALSLSERGRLVEPLLERLDNPNWKVRCYAAWTLGQSGDPRAVAPLIRLLDSRVWRERAMASFALAAIGDGRARDAMLGVADDEAWQVRINSVEYAGIFRDTEARAAVRAALADPHPAVRSAAEQASIQ